MKLTLIVLLPYILIMGFVLATGSTFGQRCSEMDYTGLEHNKCVIKLSQGKE
jgi:hypothetical protein